jgi:histidine decarboxylase
MTEPITLPNPAVAVDATAGSLADLFDAALAGGATPGRMALVRRAFDALAERHLTAGWHYLGYPVAYDLDFPETERLRTAVYRNRRSGRHRGGLINNISTTEAPPPGWQHAMEAEQSVLDWFGDLVGVDRGDRWGYLTSGGTGGNRAGILTARTRHPDAVLLYSAAAHHSVPRAAADLRIPAYPVPTLPGGQMDLAGLDTVLGVLTAGKPAGSLPVIVVATYGTTMTEASDDLAGIHQVLDTHAVDRRYLHLDAALAGIPIALDAAADFTAADSVSTSGYKFLAVPEACGIVVGRGLSSHTTRIEYTSTIDGPETGVRSGLHAAYLLEAITIGGNAGHRARAHASRALADHLITELGQIGVPAWRNREAYFTVVTPTPPAGVTDTWILAHHGATSHVLTVPGRRSDQLDAFAADWAATLETSPTVAGARRAGIPAQRTPPLVNVFADFASLAGGPA